MRLSVPSWVIPGTYSENLRFLADKKDIDGVEFLFFIYDAETKELFDREEKEIRSMAGRFAFTAHLPDPLLPAHEELVERTADFVESWVAHPGPPDSAKGLAALLRLWRIRYGDRFYAENVKPGRLEALRAEAPDLPLCMDTGHLLLCGEDPSAYLDRNRSFIKEIHLHGLGDDSPPPETAREDGRLPDHRVFPTNRGWFVDFEPRMKDFSGPIDMELFSWEEAETMVRRLKRGQL